MHASFRLLCCGSLLLLASLSLTSCFTGGASQGQKKDAELHYQLAVEAMHNDDPTTALREFRIAEDFDGGDPKIPNTMGLVFLGRKMFSEAEASFRRALELAPKLTDAQNNLCALFIELGRWDKAVEICEMAASDAFYPYPWLPKSNLGWAYFRQGKPAVAAGHLLRAVELNPRFCRGWANLGQVRMAEKDFAGAEAALRNSIEKCPKMSFPEAHFHLAVCLQRLGRNQEATEHLQKCATLAPDTPLGKQCQRALRTGSGGGGG